MTVRRRRLRALTSAISRVKVESMGNKGPKAVFKRGVTPESHTSPVGLTYYELFGVSQTATNEEIERAYRSASKAYHPDAQGPVANAYSGEVAQLFRRS